MDRFPWRFKQEIVVMQRRGATPDAVTVMINEMERHRENYTTRRKLSGNGNSGPQNGRGTIDRHEVRSSYA